MASCSWSLTGVARQADAIFSPEEEAQLQSLLALDGSKLSTILEGCSYILEQAAYHQTSASSLSKQLVAAGVQEAQAAAFGRVWKGEGAALVAKLRARSMGAPMVLNAAKWELHLQLGQSGLSRAKDARAMFELDLRDASNVEVGVSDDVARGSALIPYTWRAQDTSKADNFMLEFSHDQLYDFFQKIERVQQQLDSLS